jgi:hypothetical protein
MCVLATTLGHLPYPALKVIGTVDVFWLSKGRPKYMVGTDKMRTCIHVTTLLGQS